MEDRFVRVSEHRQPFRHPRTRLATLGRLAVGGSVLLLVLLMSGWSSRSLWAQDEPPALTGDYTLFLPFLQQASSSIPQSTPPAGPQHSDWPAQRHYTVKEDDTLLSVALELGVDLADMSCLLAPDFSWDQPLVIGDVLVVPATPFTCHKVAIGESLADIAGMYGVTVDTLRGEAWNQLAGEPRPGQNLRIPLTLPTNEPAQAVPITQEWSLEAPTASEPMAPAPPTALPLPDDWPYGSGNFAWPVYGWLTQGYHVGHRAIDVAAPLGTAVTAADRGVVIRAGWSTVGYGQFVIIDHQIDYITLYAHLSEILVEEGQVVKQGDLLGRVGSTGNSTGPHLHFEIRDFGRRVDPLTLLPH